MSANDSVDAARYRWLRDESQKDIRTLIGVGDFTTMDAFVDAAIRACQGRVSPQSDIPMQRHHDQPFEQQPDGTITAVDPSEYASKDVRVALERAAKIAMDGPLIESCGEFLYMSDDCKAMALTVSNRIRAIKDES